MPLIQCPTPVSEEGAPQQQIRVSAQTRRRSLTVQTTRSTHELIHTQPLLLLQPSILPELLPGPAQHC